MLDIIPAEITLADTGSWLIGARNREFVFSRLLKRYVKVFAQYDVINRLGAVYFSAHEYFNDCLVNFAGSSFF